MFEKKSPSLMNVTILFYSEYSDENNLMNSWIQLDLVTRSFLSAL